MFGGLKESLDEYLHSIYRLTITIRDTYHHFALIALMSQKPES